MRRRLPSPALVVACVALFLALGGAGFAASLALVRSPKPLTILPGSVSADGVVKGPRLTGTRVSEGVYTLTVRGDTFSPNAANAAARSLISPQVITIAGQNKVLDPTCDTSGETIASDGSATVEVDCFTYDPASGWQPTDAAFDVQLSGPTHS